MLCNIWVDDEVSNYVVPEDAVKNSLSVAKIPMLWKSEGIFGRILMKIKRDVEKSRVASHVVFVGFSKKSKLITSLDLMYNPLTLLSMTSVIS